MRETNLPSPGRLSNGHNLRRTAAIAISSVQMAAAHTPGGKVRSANVLKAFFTACASALDAYTDVTQPTVSTRVRTAANTVVITYSEELDPAFVPTNASYVFSPARTVTAVAIKGSTVTITATGAVTGDQVSYTQPGGANNLRDLAGNLAPTFALAAVA